MVGKNNFPLFACLTRMNDSISVVYVECPIMHLQEKHLARIPINMAIMFIQTTLFARPSIQMKDENRQNVSLKLACTVCGVDNSNAVCCLLIACVPKSFSYIRKIYCKNEKYILFHPNVMPAGWGRQVTKIYLLKVRSGEGPLPPSHTLTFEYYIKSIYIP